MCSGCALLSVVGATSRGCSENGDFDSLNVMLFLHETFPSAEKNRKNMF
jgi:hypothetical protein